MKKYNLTARYRFFYLAIYLLVLLGIFIPIIYLTRNLSSVSQFFSITGGLVAILIFTRINNESIRISKDWIEYQTVGLAFRTNWNSIQGFSFSRYQGVWQDCLLVSNSAITITNKPLYERYSFKNLMPQKIFIPLSCFSDNWRDSELGQQIKQFAPHLFK